ncbi:MAG: 5-(carboxyamino)imidazole ribonucleotide mutase [Anaerolineae bacterium]
MPEPQVAILMGSDSDLPVMKGAADVLTEFGVPHEVRVLSAHRSPDRTAAYVRQAPGRGIKVFIAGAGMAAHLAGVVAAHTSLPVIGVPLRSTRGLDGADALYATVMMPPGIPVATVAIGGAKNAAHLAIRMLALGDAELAARVDEYRAAMDEGVAAKNEKLDALGVEGYLAERA